MERPIGDIFPLPNGDILKVIEQHGCKGCYFEDGSCIREEISNIVGECMRFLRTNNTPVIFIKVNEVKVFVINETEWIVAETLEDAIAFEGISPEEIASQSIQEIPKEEWNDTTIEVEVINSDLDISHPRIIHTQTVRNLVAQVIGKDLPCKIMSEDF